MIRHNDAALGAVQTGDEYPLPTSLTTAGVIMPVDVQAVLRVAAIFTATNLAASATYVSASIDAIQYRRLTAIIHADQAGVYRVEHSDNGSNWHHSGNINLTASTLAKVDEVIYARYVRLVFINGTTAQTAFRLSGFLSAQ